MNRHDALVIIAAQERYAELLKMAEQERRLRASFPHADQEVL